MKSNDPAGSPDDIDSSNTYVGVYKSFAENQPAQTSMKLPNEQNVTYEV